MLRLFVLINSAHIDSFNNELAIIILAVDLELSVPVVVCLCLFTVEHPIFVALNEDLVHVYLILNVTLYANAFDLSVNHGYRLHHLHLFFLYFDRGT